MKLINMILAVVSGFISGLAASVRHCRLLQDLNDYELADAVNYERPVYPNGFPDGMYDQAWPPVDYIYPDVTQDAFGYQSAARDQAADRDAFGYPRAAFSSDHGCLSHGPRVEKNM